MDADPRRAAASGPGWPQRGSASLPGPGAPARSAAGLGAADMLVALALVAVATVSALPAADSWRQEQVVAGAREVATSCAAMRWRAIAEVRQYGLWFEEDERGWLWWHVADGNGNGLRTAELRAGEDRIVDGPYRLESRVSSIRVALPGRPVPRIPPESGWLDRPWDPVRMGPSDIVSFSPNGRTSTGTIYVTDDRSAVAGVRLFGATGRTRLWRYRFAEGRWKT